MMDNVAAVIILSNGNLFDFEGELSADHPANPLKKIPMEQKILDSGYIIVENGKEPTLLDIRGDILNGIFEVVADESDIVYIKREFTNALRLMEVTSPLRFTAGESQPLPIHIPQKTSLRFEINIDDPDYTEALAWITARENDIFVEPKLVGLRTIASKDAIYLEGSEVNQIKRFPELAAELSTLDEKSSGIVLDGELVQAALHVFSVLKTSEQDLRGESEEVRLEALEQLGIDKNEWIQKIPYARLKKGASKDDWGKALQVAFDAENSEGAMLKHVLSTTNQKWNSDWAKVKLVRYYVGRVLGKTQVDDPNRDTWVYELGFKNKHGKLVSLGTSMATGIELKKGDYAVVALPASGVWETPIVKGKSDRKTVDDFVPKSRFGESGTPLWVECEEMEAELAAGVNCGRLREVVARSWEIYSTDWVYPGERDYAYSIWNEASGDEARCTPSISRETDTMDFGDVQVDETGIISTWISNDADTEGDDLDIEIVIVGSTTLFSVSENSFTVQPGETRNFDFYATSESPGDRSAAFEVTTNDIHNPILWYSVSAIFTGGEPKLTYDWSSYDFGSVSVYDYGEMDQVITNDGTGDLELSNFYVETDGAIFRIIGDDSDVTVAPGDSYSLTVGFFPPEIGFWGGTLWMNSNDPVWAQIGFRLYGGGEE